MTLPTTAAGDDALGDRGADGRALRARAARHHAIMVAIIVAWCALSWYGERIPAAGGIGFDGVVYADIAREPATALRDKYYLQRALPSWTVHSVLRLTQRPLSDLHIVAGFYVLNCLVLIGVALLWRPLADRLDLGVPARWLGFIGLFANFAFLKLPFYYPVLTDVAALGLGIAAVFGSLSGRRWLVALAVLAASFTWPLGALLGCFLLLWPPGSLAPPVADRPGSLATLAAAGAAGSFLAWFVWLYVVRGQAVRASHLAVAVVPGWVWVGIAAAMVYIFLATRALLAGLTFRYMTSVIRAIRPIGVLLLLASMLPVRILSAQYGEIEAILSARQFIGNVVLLGSSRPLLFAISHIVYFGPLLLLLGSADARHRFLQIVRGLGPGWTLLVLGSVALSLNSESRHSTFQYAAVVALLVAGAPRHYLTPRAVSLIGILALVMSKFWLPINVEPAKMVDVTDPLLAVHYGRYFMNHGPWMANGAYIVHTLLVLAAGALVWAVARGGHRAPDASTPPLRS